MAFREEPVFLRALDLSDVERTHRWHSDPSLYATLVNPFRHVSRSAEEEWLRHQAAFSTAEVNLAICIADTREHIGNIYLRHIDWIARHASIGILIGEAQHRSKGYGQSALGQITRHAFDDLGMQRLYLDVIADNTPAIRAYEKAGFVLEGALRRHVFKQGQWKDVLLMGLCAPEDK